MPGDTREYRARHPENGTQTGTIGIGLLGITMGLAYMAKSGAPLWVPLLVAAAAVPIALAKTLPRRSWTSIDAEHLTVRRPLSTRATPWRDIQAVELRRHWNGAESATAHDAHGRRIRLPHLNSWTVPEFHAEVDRLRDTWTRHRGDDWAARFEN
ncbi:PH domain-containing protein [Glycomyces sp. NPDC049804]|uniref:PH domain-containing protein n=1 Tax=Glycomyces sp. NPDC049804 TaxID=3154363 RepID=UPI00344AF662